MKRRLLVVGLVLAVAAGLLSVPALAAAAQTTEAVVQDFSSTEYPNVSFRLSLPASMLSDEGAVPDVKVSENGESLRNVKVEPIEAGRESVYTVLVIDTSGSMQGAPIKDAKAAAGRFVDTLGPSAQIALVAFSDEPRVVQGFTDDPVKLKAAIASLQAKGETAVYDGLVTASRLVPDRRDVRRNIVVLSDGTDTVSSTTLEVTMKELRQRGVPVHAVALQSKDFNPRALEIVATGSGGRLVPVAQSSALTGLFEGIARELRDSWKVTYVSSRPETKDIDVDVAAALGASEAAARFAYANPRYASLGKAANLRLPEVHENYSAYAGAIGLAFLAVAFLVGGAILLFAPRRTGLNQLRFYDQMHAETDSASTADPNGMRAKVVDAVGYVAGKRGFTAALSAKLEQAGLPLRAAEYMTIHILLVVGLGFLTQLLLNNFVLSLVVVLVATFVPLLALNMAVDSRRHRFEAQLPDVLTMISSSLRAGWGVQQALDLVVQEAGPPASQDFRRIQTETRLGMPIEEALQKMADRLQSEDFQSAVTAIVIQREVGGNLAEVLDVVAKTVRDRASLRRQISALTAEGRLSAYILVALPLGVALFLGVTRPEYLLPFVTTSMGMFMAVLGVVLMIVGTIWLFKATQIEV